MRRRSRSPTVDTHVSRSFILFQFIKTKEFAYSKMNCVLVRVFVLVIIYISSLGERACAICANSELSVDVLTEARIEFVKQQILKKLRLNKKPDVAVPVNSLPMPVAQGVTYDQATDKPPEFDDYYGRTEQKIIFPVEGNIIYMFFYLLLATTRGLFRLNVFLYDSQIVAYVLFQCIMYKLF